ncbi:uncharacterized protein LOC110032404 [Phalaenopsis equestris]|uniref:uncharacterized protein LOC110032404 n=1 Tax=Phalaenopsis equestris TaxID=78828 RepID=UPI0009E284EE|nr:uncharacterized protein LOC110032404 [Phalaenopsis equestris]
MKNPKSAAGGRGSSHKTSAANAVGGADGRKSHWDSSKKPPSDRNAPSDSTPFKEDIPGPSSGPMKHPAGATLPAASLPPTFHHHTSASSPPPPPYGFHNLDRRTIVLADGTVRSYFALPPDYQMDPRGDKFFHPGNPQGFDPHIPGPYGPEGFREPPPPFPRGGADYWSSLGLEGPAGSSSLKRKYGEEEFDWRRQQAPQRGSSAVNSGFSSGPVGDGLGRTGSPSRKEHVDDRRLSKQVKLGGEGYDDLPARKPRAESNDSLVARDVDPKALKEAFLRLSKSISENPTHMKNYLEDGKNGPLQCIVCGRGGKEFTDVHGLVMHSYNSPNPDLRIEHLGLHKALCVMLGWNYAKTPDNSKEYQSLSADEARGNREDLILWPPAVIIHNTSTGKRKDGRMEGLGNKEMDVKLKELGFGGGKAKSVYGKEGHSGFTAVRFLNSEVGLREAEKLSEYFEKENRGRKGWARVQASLSGNNDEKNPDLVKVDKKTGEKSRVFYGYLATAMDLDKVDFEMRKKVVIKSRKELDFD